MIFLDRWSIWRAQRRLKATHTQTHTHGRTAHFVLLSLITLLFYTRTLPGLTDGGERGDFCDSAYDDVPAVPQAELRSERHTEMLRHREELPRIPQAHTAQLIERSCPDLMFLTKK